MSFGGFGSNSGFGQNNQQQSSGFGSSGFGGTGTTGGRFNRLQTPFLGGFHLFLSLFFFCFGALSHCLFASVGGALLFCRCLSVMEQYDMAVAKNQTSLATPLFFFPGFQRPVRFLACKKVDLVSSIATWIL